MRDKEEMVSINLSQLDDTNNAALNLRFFVLGDENHTLFGGNFTEKAM